MEFVFFFLASFEVDFVLAAGASGDVKLLGLESEIGLPGDAEVEFVVKRRRSGKLALGSGSVPELEEDEAGFR